VDLAGETSWWAELARGGALIFADIGFDATGRWDPADLAPPGQRLGGLTGGEELLHPEVRATRAAGGGHAAVVGAEHGGIDVRLSAALLVQRDQGRLLAAEAEQEAVGDRRGLAEADLEATVGDEMAGATRPWAERCSSKRNSTEFKEK
jgi:hypothetical protein